ncbi:MAG: 4-oxalocrotonate tautomerase family protein [Planctomycetota bacterium]
MPYVDVRLTPAITRNQKAAVVAGITQVLVDVLGKDPQHTHVVIDEVAEENWGYGGELTDTLRGTTPPEATEVGESAS